MVPTVDRAKATVMTKVRFDEIDPRILPEMSAKVTFLSQEVSADQQSRCWRWCPRRSRSATAAPSSSWSATARAVAVPVTTGAKIGDLTADRRRGAERRQGRAAARPRPRVAARW